MLIIYIGAMLICQSQIVHNPKDEMIEILNSSKALQQNRGCNFPKVAIKSHKFLSTMAEISRSTHFLANFTIEKIGNEAGLKCMDISI